MPGFVAGDDLVFFAAALKVVELASHLDCRFRGFGTSGGKFHSRQVTRCEIDQAVGKLNGDGVGTVHDRCKCHLIQLFTDSVNDASVIVSYVGDVNSGQSVKVLFSFDVPVVHPIGAGHQEWITNKVGHLCPDENLPEKPLFSGLGYCDTFRDRVSVWSGHGGVSGEEKKNFNLQLSKKLACLATSGRLLIGTEYERSGQSSSG